MAKEIYEFDAVAADNNFSPTLGGFPEGMLRSDVNNGLREHLAAIRRFYNDSQWIRCRIQGPAAGDIGVFTRVSANQFTITLTGVNLSSYFTDKRVILIKDGTSPGVDLVTQCNGNATYGANVTTVNTVAAMAVGATDAYAHSNSVMRKQALLEDRTDFYIPATNDSAGIQQAINDASTAGSGIVLLTASSYSITTQLDINAGKGNITILGAGVQTTLLRQANINSIINFDNSTESLTLMNLKLDGNFINFSGGNGYGLNIANCGAVSVINCDFARCNHAINVSGTNCKKILINGSTFTYTRYGVVTGGVNDTHEGVISNCTFDGTLLSGATPASIKVSGSWRVIGNIIRNFGTAATTPIGIWIWDKTAPGNGGFNSAVIGNEIKTSQSTGTAIWMGADDGQCIGNTVQTSSGGIGILVGSVAAAQFAERVTVHGNSIRQGSRGISVLENCRHAAIIGNSIRPTSGTCIEVSGDTSNIHDNLCHRDASIGIDLLSTAVNNTVKSNHILDVTNTGIIIRSGADSNEVAYNKFSGVPSNAVTVELGATTNRVVQNFAPYHLAPINNLSTTTRYIRNRTADMIDWQYSGIVNVNSTVAASVTMISSRALPGDGGIGRYKVRWKFAVAAGVQIIFDLRVGTTGVPTSDTSVYTNAVNASTTETGDLTNEFFFDVTDALWTRWSVGASRAAGAATDGEAWIEIIRVSEPFS